MVLTTSTFIYNSTFTMYLCIFKCLGLCIAIWLGFCYLHSAFSLSCLLLCDQSVVSTRFSLIVFVFLWQGVICVKQNSPSLFSFSPFGRQNGFAPWSAIVYGNNINSSAEQLVFNLQVHLCLFRSPKPLAIHLNICWHFTEYI